MEWDEEIAKGAEEWVKKIKAMGALAHSSREERKEAGENLYMSFTTKLPADYSPCKEATVAW